MAALHLAQITCDIGRCSTRFPNAPAKNDVTDLRMKAATVGWEVMNREHGRDACPRCRIAEIRRLSNEAEASEGD